jgi:hypothetical protein
MKLTETHLRNLIKQEIKASLNEAFDTTEYQQQLQQIYSDLISKVKSGEATYDEVASIGLPEEVKYSLRSAAQSYKASLRTPEQKAASSAKAAATRQQRKMDDASYTARYQARQASEIATAQQRREDGYAPIYPNPQGNMIPNPMFYDAENDPRSGYVNYKLKDKYVNIRNIGPLYIDEDERDMY